jgi:hypothetical protein
MSENDSHLFVTWLYTSRSPAQLGQIKLGRAPGDASDTAGAVMLPKGGNPALTDQNLADIVAYIRSLGKK